VITRRNWATRSSNHEDLPAIASEEWIEAVDDESSQFCGGSEHPSRVIRENGFRPSQRGSSRSELQNSPGSVDLRAARLPPAAGLCIKQVPNDTILFGYEPLLVLTQM
jgi:hypothetical protein